MHTYSLAEHLTDRVANKTESKEGVEEVLHESEKLGYGVVED